MRQALQALQALQAAVATPRFVTSERYRKPPPFRGVVHVTHATPALAEGIKVERCSCICNATRVVRSKKGLPVGGTRQ